MMLFGTNQKAASNHSPSNLNRMSTNVTFLFYGTSGAFFGRPVLLYLV